MTRLIETEAIWVGSYIEIACSTHLSMSDLLIDSKKTKNLTIVDMRIFIIRIYSMFSCWAGKKSNNACVCIIRSIAMLCLGLKMFYNLWPRPFAARVRNLFPFNILIRGFISTRGKWYVKFWPIFQHIFIQHNNEILRERVLAFLPDCED